MQQHAIERELNPLQGRPFVESQAQFGIVARVHDGQNDEVNIVAAVGKTQIGAARRLDVGRSEGAAYAAGAVGELRVAALAVNDREIEQVGGLRFGVERGPHLEFVGQHPRKGSGVLDEQILVTLAYHDARRRNTAPAAARGAPPPRTR